MLEREGEDNMWLDDAVCRLPNEQKFNPELPDLRMKNIQKRTVNSSSACLGIESVKNLRSFPRHRSRHCCSGRWSKNVIYNFEFIEER